MVLDSRNRHGVEFHSAAVLSAALVVHFSTNQLCILRSSYVAEDAVYTSKTLFVPQELWSDAVCPRNAVSL